MSRSTKKASPTLVWAGIVFSFVSDITRRQTHSYRTRANLPNHHDWVGYSWRGRGRRRFNRMPMMSSRSWTWYACVWVYTERLLGWLCSVARCVLARLWGLISCCCCCWLQNRMTIHGLSVALSCIEWNQICTLHEVTTIWNSHIRWCRGLLYQFRAWKSAVRS